MAICGDEQLRRPQGVRLGGVRMSAVKDVGRIESVETMGHGRAKGHHRW
jgi:hypothetical protein